MPHAPRPLADEHRGYFAATPPGLEQLVVRELDSLGLRAQASPGGVSFSGRRADLYRANLYLRTASRVLVRLGEFHAAAFSEVPNGIE